MSEIKAGEKLSLQKNVTREFLACEMGSGSVPVLATPAVVAFLEEACAALVSPSLPEGITTVGTRLELDHLCASAEGAPVRAEAELLEIDGRVYRFRVAAYDNAGLIAEGKHERVSVKAERFVEKARERARKS